MKKFVDAFAIFAIFLAEERVLIFVKTSKGQKTNISYYSHRCLCSLSYFTIVFDIWIKYATALLIPIALLAIGYKT